MSSMPRGERPLDEGDSPLLQFAGDLRRLRAEAGSPTYRVLAQRAHFAITTLSEAASGRKLPGLDVTLAYVRACGGDEDTWAQRWHEVDESLFQSRVSPSPYVGLSAFTREDADRTVLAAAGLGYYEIRLWDVVRWTSLPPLRMERLKQRLAFTPRRSPRRPHRFEPAPVVARQRADDLWSRGASARRRPGRDRAHVRQRRLHRAQRRRDEPRQPSRHRRCHPFTAAFSQHAKLVATSGNDGAFSRDAASGQVLSKLTAANGETPRALAFAGDEVVTLSGAHSTAVRTVRPEPTPERVGAFLDGVPTAVTFGRSAHEIVIGSEEGIVAVQDTRTWATKGLGKVHDDAVRAFALSPDKRVLATGGDDGLITLWNTSTWQRIGELRGHTSGVTALGFSPDSARLASGGTDKNVVVWDLQDHSVWATLTGHSEVVKHVAWMPDSRSVVSAGPDALLVWPLDVETALRALS